MNARRMLTLAVGAVWVAVAVPVAVVVGRAIRRADVAARLTRVPQLDVPLWRGTDLEVTHETWDEWPAARPCPGCAHGECLRSCPPGTCGAIDDDEAVRAALEPLPEWSPEPQPFDEPYLPANLAGAILGLAFATDATAARYWLAVCARRGADQRTLAELEDEWRRQHLGDVQTWTTALDLDREDPDHDR